MKPRFAVIGHPISHSLSPLIHQYFAEQCHLNLIYEPLLGDLQLFEQQVSDFFIQGGKGLNITLPFKERAFALAKSHTPRCVKAKAANTLWMCDGILHADNTDGMGFIRDLSRFISLNEKRVLLLGAGGAARGIIQPILEMQPDSLLVSNRTVEKLDKLQKDFPEIHCAELQALKTPFDLVINATSSSFGETLNVPLECFAKKPFCYDLAYQLRGLTPFVRYVQGLGCEAIDGLGMLVEQAAEAFYLWNGKQATTEPVLKTLLAEKLFD